MAVRLGMEKKRQIRMQLAKWDERLRLSQCGWYRDRVEAGGMEDVPTETESRQVWLTETKSKQAGWVQNSAGPEHQPCDTSEARLNDGLNPVARAFVKGYEDRNRAERKPRISTPK